MATATSSLNLELEPELLEDLSKMRELAFSGEKSRKNTVTLAEFAADLIEAQVAEFRLKQIPPDFLERESHFTSDETLGNNTRHRGMSAATAQRIVHLHFEEGIPENVIAKRFGIGESTVRRVTLAYKRAKHVQIPPRREPQRGAAI